MGFVGGANSNVQFIADDKFNIGIAVSIGGGASAPSISLQGGLEVTSCEEIYNTSGSAVSVSMGGGEGVVAAGEYTTLYNSEAENPIQAVTTGDHGGRVSVGVGASGTLLSGSLSYSETVVVGVNLKTAANSIGTFFSNLSEVITGDRNSGDLLEGVNNPFGAADYNGDTAGAANKKDEKKDEN